MNAPAKFPATGPSAVPTEDEIAAWQSLPRDEQLRRLRSELDHPDCKRVTTANIDDIRADGRALAETMRNG